MFSELEVPRGASIAFTVNSNKTQPRSDVDCLELRVGRRVRAAGAMALRVEWQHCVARPTAVRVQLWFLTSKEVMIWIS